VAETQKLLSFPKHWNGELRRITVAAHHGVPPPSILNLLAKAGHRLSPSSTQTHSTSRAPPHLAPQADGIEPLSTISSSTCCLVLVIVSCCTHCSLKIYGADSLVWMDEAGELRRTASSGDKVKSAISVAGPPLNMPRDIHFYGFSMLNLGSAWMGAETSLLMAQKSRRCGKDTLELRTCCKYVSNRHMAKVFRFVRFHVGVQTI